MSNVRLFTDYLLSRSFWLFILLGALFGANKVNAQCTPWVIEVTPAPATSQIACGADGTPCHILYYYVYLTDGGNQNATTPTNFDFFYIGFNGNLSVLTGPGTQTRLSHLDKVNTLSCSPSDINSGAAAAPVLEINESTGEFSYTVLNQNLNGSGEYTEINWQVTGRKLLFILAVNAFPGEVITPNLLLPLSMVWKKNGVQTTCSPAVVSNSLSKSVDIPTTSCTNNFVLRIGAPIDDPTPGHPLRKRLSVFVSNNGSANIEINDLDFLIAVASNISMSEVSAISGLQSVTVSVFQQSSTLNTANHRIYASASSIKVKPNASTTLFDIFINGPSLNSECGTTTLLFTPYRRAIFMGDCCLPDAAPAVSSGTPSPIPVSIPWNGANGCLHCSALTVNVKRSTVVPPDACHSLAFDLSLSTSASRRYTSGTITVDVTHSGSLALDLTNCAVGSGVDPIVPKTNQFKAEEISPTVLRVTFIFEQTFSPPVLVDPGTFSTFFYKIAHLAFTGNDVCISSVYFHDAVLFELDASDNCIPTQVATDVTAADATDDICLSSVAMTFESYITSHPRVFNVNYELSTNTAPLCNQFGIATDGSAARCACPGTMEQTLKPTQDDNHINGVSTFDLVLISKHILGIEPLTNPYQMIAADANKSNTITTFDIVELRKLILGIYTKLPNNTSWRFVDQSYTFPNPANPWQAAFPETRVFTLTNTVNNIVANFYGIKIGDINGNAVLNFLQTEDRQQNALLLGYVPSGGKSGQVLEIPVFAQQATDLTAWQISLQYATDALKVKGVRWTTAAQPTNYQSQDWHTPTPGELRLSWMDGTGAAVHLEANAPLCYIQVELLRDQSDIAFNITPETKDFSSESYAANGTPATLSLLPVRNYQAPATPTPSIIDVKPIWTAAIYPNPAQSQFRIEVSLPEGGSGAITFFDALGRSRATQSCIFVPGLNSVSSAQFPALPAGQYLVRIDTPLGRQTIRIVLLQ